MGIVPDGQSLREFLAKNFRLDKDGDSYSRECYVEHDDELSEKQIKEILASDDPMGTFWDQLRPDEWARRLDFVNRL